MSNNPPFLSPQAMSSLGVPFKYCHSFTLCVVRLCLHSAVFAPAQAHPPLLPANRPPPHPRGLTGGYNGATRALCTPGLVLLLAPISSAAITGWHKVTSHRLSTLFGNGARLLRGGGERQPRSPSLTHRTSGSFADDRSLPRCLQRCLAD